ncbi:MAG: nickel-dependent lactate racemase [Bryobacterales bacterium]|nr:nickel-dependent lactate racemase [Bryobacterales bacterium]
MLPARQGSGHKGEPMEVQLAFDRDGASVLLPDGLDTQILRPRFAAGLPDENRALEEAITNPIGCPSLRELARGKRSAAIAVCDITRPAPNKVVLPHVIRALEAGGVPAHAIAILIATGLHREATADELDEILGAEILARHPVRSHRAREIDEQTFLGETSGGTQAFVDERFVEADLHITLGFIEPHLMAGFSGGRKLISIGLAGERTIKRLHSPLYMRDADATEGSFPDNPLHRELLEIAAMAGHDFMVDVALTDTRSIAAVFAGEPVATHAQGVAFVRQSTLARVEEPADAVITTSGGYPLDLTFYQAVKGLTAAAHVVRDGGEILLAAACKEGLGGPEFSALVRSAGDSSALLDALTNRAVQVDQWQAEKLAMVADRAQLSFCVPGLSEDDRSKLWGPAHADPQEAVDGIVGRLGSGARLVVIPEGPYVFSQLAPSADAGLGAR